MRMKSLLLALLFALLGLSSCEKTSTNEESLTKAWSRRPTAYAPLRLPGAAHAKRWAALMED